MGECLPIRRSILKRCSSKPRLPPDWHCYRSKTYPDQLYFYNVKTKISIWDVAEVMKIAKSEKKVTFSPTVRCQSSTTLESGSVSVERSHERFKKIDHTKKTLVTRKQVTWVEELPPLEYDGHQQSQSAEVNQVRLVNTVSQVTPQQFPSSPFPNPQVVNQSLSLEIQASLSSSRCLLKRNRDQFEEDSEDKENIPRPKASNIFRSPDKDREAAIRKRGMISEGWCESNNNTY